MSFQCVGMVLDRYHAESAGELLLAIMIASHADDIGENVYPSVMRLARTTQQSRRTVQYQLRLMEEKGWLQMTAYEGERPSPEGALKNCRQYRINPDWVGGADLRQPPPAQPLHGGSATIAQGGSAVVAQGGALSLRGGSAVVAPKPVIESVMVKQKSTRERAPAAGTVDPLQAFPDVDPDLVGQWMAVRKSKRAGALTPLAVAGIVREAGKANLSVPQVLTLCCERNWTSFFASWDYPGKPPRAGFNGSGSGSIHAARAAVIKAMTGEG